METDLVSLSRGIFIVQLLFTALKAVRPPPQNSAKAKKLGGGSTTRKSPMVQLIISGDEQNPTD